MIGQKLPEIKFEAFHENEIKEMDLAKLKGKWHVLFFYPKDFTFVCPTELEDMANHYEEFKKAGAEVISFSTDTSIVHKAWQDASEAIKKIKYPMGADPTGKICRAMGTYIPEEGVSLRGSFIVDPDGVIQVYEVHNDGIGRSAAELLRKLQAASFVREHGDQVCPANWKPGSDTLKPGLDLVGKI
ncbi:redoxin domain-containing protein [Patescibacteria group bacterium]|nr:redoxin domain-containing protein [Patescibacteria group bacterium]